MYHRFNRALQSFSRCNSAVGLNKHAQAIEVGTIADTHVLDFVINAAYGRKYGIQSNGADIHALFLVRLFWHVP